jgi:uncharacterized membrane protein YhaH (DUF805 family)
MKNEFVTLFLRPTGEINAKAFLAGFAGIAVFVLLANSLLRALEAGPLKFTIALIFPFLALYVIYCVYGKRLHYMGYSVWPLTGLITAEILMMIGLMLAFGGAEYFESFSQYERKAVIDENTRRALIETYQAEQAANMGKIKFGLWVLPVLWLALAPKRPRKARR